MRVYYFIFKHGETPSPSILDILGYKDLRNRSRATFFCTYPLATGTLIALPGLVSSTRNAIYYFEVVQCNKTRLDTYLTS